MQFKNGDIVTLHNVNEIRLGLKMSAFNEDIESRSIVTSDHIRKIKCVA
jgi:hypothetical protein